MKLHNINILIKKLIIFCGFSLILFTKSDPVYSQLAGTEDPKIHEKLFNEELFISTDRDLYIAGEKVWIKIYKLNGLTHTPANISKVVYADLLDLENNPVKQLKIGMDGLSGSSVFILPDTLRSGNYIVRSYTSWMENFSKDLFAFKTISVINPFDKISNLKVPQTITNADSMIFYPEGGHLQSGIETILGFRSLDRRGMPVQMHGVLINDKNDTLSHVKTGNNGYGIISLKLSDTGSLYLITSSENKQRKFPLPQVYKEGILLTSPHSGAIVKLNISPDKISTQSHLIMSINSSGLSGSRDELLPVQEPELSITGDELPKGISHLLVLDEHKNILTERWVSNGNSNLINYTIDPGKTGYAQREKVRIVISATDNFGKPVESDISISVAKTVGVKRSGTKYNNNRQMPGLSPVNEDCSSSGLNDYLIFCESFETGSDQVGNSFDNDPVHLPELDGHLISGTIRDRVSGEPISNENLTLSFVGKAALCLFTKTDSAGNFNFVTRGTGMQEIVIQPLIPKKECYVDLKNSLPSGYNKYDHGLLFPDTSKLEQLNNLIISTQINNIYEPFYQNPGSSKEEQPQQNFYGKPDNSVLISKYIELTSVKEMITELIPGVATFRSNGKINFRVKKPHQTALYQKGPLVLVDGVPVYDYEKVIAINSNDIDRVDVMIDRYFISGNVLDGIVHFITKKGNLSAMDLDKSIFRMEYDLLQKKEFFYSPDYSIDSVRNNHLPDFRNTLYWNPDLHTGKDGKAQIEFYSSDEAAEYSIIVEGISGEGQTGTASAPLLIKSK